MAFVLCRRRRANELSLAARECEFPDIDEGVTRTKAEASVAGLQGRRRLLRWWHYAPVLPDESN
jgi:hypothetical protein